MSVSGAIRMEDVNRYQLKRQPDADAIEIVAIVCPIVVNPNAGSTMTIKSCDTLRPWTSVTQQTAADPGNSDRMDINKISCW